MKLRSAAAAAALCSACSSSPSSPPAPLPPPALEGSASGAGSSAPLPTAIASTDATATPVPLPPPTEPATDVERSNQVAANVLREVGKTPGNTFVSPPGLRLALGMTFVGAQGKTQEEMQKALAFGDPSGVPAAAKAEIAAWSGLNGKDVEIAVANRLYVEKSQPLDKTFTATVKDGWGAPADAVDFKGAAENARKGINGWVKKQTKDKIPDLLPEGSLTNLTRVVLVNAVYLNAKWTVPFDKSATAPASFSAGSTSETVPFMRRTGKFRYGETPDAKVLEMPYGKGDVAMVFVLPKARDGLAAIEGRLAFGSFAEWRSKLADEMRVEVALPKFEFSYGGSVKPVLGALGMRAAFEDRGEFDKMAPKAGLFVSDVFHKTFVRVDEAGTEAAAATAAVMAVRSAVVGEPKSFVADHPFLFYLVDTKQNRVLFLGRMANPKK